MLMTWAPHPGGSERRIILGGWRDAPGYPVCGGGQGNALGRRQTIGGVSILHHMTGNVAPIHVPAANISGQARCGMSLTFDGTLRACGHRVCRYHTAILATRRQGHRLRLALRNSTVRTTGNTRGSCVRGVETAHGIRTCVKRAAITG
jgi:hypothetical protein